MDIARPDRKKKKQRKRLIQAIAAATFVILVTVGLSRLEPAARQVDRTAVWVDTVKRGEMLRQVRGTGTLVPEEIRWIAAETEARVDRVIVDPGAEVTPDTVILELSNATLEQTAQDAELQYRASQAEYTDLRVRLESETLDQQANLARVKADYEGAKLQLAADRELFENGLIPDINLRRSELEEAQLQIRKDIEVSRMEKTMESIEAQLAVRRSQVEQSQALYQLRKNQLDSLFVRAGIEGILQQVPVEEGQRIMPGTNLARVAQPDRLKAELRVNETQAKDVLIGQRTNIDTRNGVVEGKVARIDPAVRQGTVTVEVHLVGDLPKGARPDLSVDGTIEIERLEDVLYVDRPAYGQANSTIGLYRLAEDGSSATRIPVRLGRTSVKTVEIIAGLDVGDEVILSDSSQWDDSERIKLVD